MGNKEKKTFAIGLRSFFTKSKIEFHRTGSILVYGEIPLNLPECPNEWDAQIAVQIGKNWFQQRPKVTCLNDWLKIDIDWHVFEDRSLCWVYSREWRENLRRLRGKTTNKNVCAHALAWMMRNTKFLLSCHMVGRSFGVTEWQPEWPQYSHGDDALPEYLENEKRRK